MAQFPAESVSGAFVDIPVSVSVMPRIPRRLLLDPTEVGVYHGINRCVRRAFLCRRDAEIGKSFEHCMEWIQNRLQFLAGQFGIDVLGFAVMSNHLHVVLRKRPDVVRDGSDREVALRWWPLFPTRGDEIQTGRFPPMSRAFSIGCRSRVSRG